MSKQWAAFGAGPWAGLAFGRGGRFFESGEIRLAILSLLEEAPKHGYQLMKELAERSGGMYKASAGSVYPTLQQLENESLVKAELKSGRRVFHLTAAGRQQLNGDPEAVRRIWERAERCEDWGQFLAPETFSLWPPLRAVVKAGMQAASRVGQTPDGAERVRSILDRTRRELDSLKD